MDEPSKLTIGSQFLQRGFELIELFPHRGMSELWRGRQLDPARDVIVKLLPQHLGADQQYRMRFERETLVQSNLAHPNIVPVYAAGEIEGRKYFVMEYLGGGSLRQKLEQGSLPPARCIAITIDIANALGTAHRGDYVHRDIKPENILFRTTCDDAVLTDFGIAGFIRKKSPQTQQLSQIGTPGYMSPEQIKGLLPSEASDIFSLGIVLYEMLMGTNPYFRNVPEDKIPQLGKKLQSIQPIIDRMLSPDPEKRFPDTTDLIKALQKEADRFAKLSDENTSNRLLPAILGGVSTAVVVAVAAALIMPSKQYPVAVDVSPGTAMLSMVQDGTDKPLPAELPAGKYRVNAAAPGYKPQVAEIELPAPKKKEIQLQPNAITAREFIAYLSTIKTRKKPASDSFLAKFPDSPLADVVRVEAGQKSFDIVMKAAEAGDALAQLAVAELYESGIGVEKNIDIALQWSARAASSGFVLAVTQNALSILQSSASEEQKLRAVDALKAAAKKGLFIAQTKLGIMFFEGKFVEQDMPKAVELLAAAAQQQDPFAMEYLSTIYATGYLNEPANPEKAQTLHNQAVALLNPR